MMGGPGPLFTHVKPESASAMQEHLDSWLQPSPGALTLDNSEKILSCLSWALTQDHRIAAKRATIVLTRG